MMIAFDPSTTNPGILGAWNQTELCNFYTMKNSCGLDIYTIKVHIENSIIMISTLKAKANFNLHFSIPISDVKIYQYFCAMFKVKSKCLCKHISIIIIPNI